MVANIRREVGTETQSQDTTNETEGNGQQFIQNSMDEKSKLTIILFSISFVQVERRSASRCRPVRTNSSLFTITLRKPQFHFASIVDILNLFN